MAPRNLDPHFSISLLSEETLFTLAALRADPEAADLAGPHEIWLARARLANQTQQELADAVTMAEAVATQRRLALKSTILDFAADLLALVGRDRQDPRWTLFFPESPSLFVVQACPVLLERVGAWPGNLVHEPALAAWIPTFEEHLRQNRDAAGILAEAEGRLARWRVHEREALFAEVNLARAELYAQLCLRLRRPGLRREWTDTFFRVGRPARRSARVEPEPTNA